jgi:hypothetical protein
MLFMQRVFGAPGDQIVNRGWCTEHERRTQLNVRPSVAHHDLRDGSIQDFPLTYGIGLPDPRRGRDHRRASHRASRATRRPVRSAPRVPQVRDLPELVHPPDLVLVLAQVVLDDEVGQRRELLLRSSERCLRAADHLLGRRLAVLGPPPMASFADRGIDGHALEGLDELVGHAILADLLRPADELPRLVPRAVIVEVAAAVLVVLLGREVAAASAAEQEAPVQEVPEGRLLPLRVPDHFLDEELFPRDHRRVLALVEGAPALDLARVERVPEHRVA